MRKSLLCILALCLPAFAAEPAPVKVTKTTSAVEFMIGDELFTRYVVDTNVAKPFFWPLHAPGEIPVTRGWPMQKALPSETTDHVHQKSAWFCHGDVIPEGIGLKVRSADKRVAGVDFWSETPGHGKIVCTEVSDVKFKGNVGAVGTKNEWRTSDGVKILDEVRAMAVVNFGDARLITLDIDLHASVCPITFGDTKEGSMGVRVNDSFRLNGPKSDGAIVSSDGLTAKAPAKDNLPMWGKRADWHDYSGTVDGKTVGIAIFDHPKNAQRAAWHTRAYGLMAANPFGRAGSGFPDVKGQTELVKLAKGEHLKFRYGILVHRSDAKESKVADIFQQFAKD